MGGFLSDLLTSTFDPHYGLLGRPASGALRSTLDIGGSLDPFKYIERGAAGLGIPYANELVRQREEREAEVNQFLDEFLGSGLGRKMIGEPVQQMSEEMLDTEYDRPMGTGELLRSAVSPTLGEGDIPEITKGNIDFPLGRETEQADIDLARGISRQAGGAVEGIGNLVEMAPELAAIPSAPGVGMAFLPGIAEGLGTNLGEGEYGKALIDLLFAGGIGGHTAKLGGKPTGKGLGREVVWEAPKEIAPELTRPRDPYEGHLFHGTPDATFALEGQSLKPSEFGLLGEGRYLTERPQGARMYAESLGDIKTEADFKRDSTQTSDVLGVDVRADKPLDMNAPAPRDIRMKAMVELNRQRGEISPEVYESYKRDILDPNATATEVVEAGSYLKLQNIPMEERATHKGDPTSDFVQSAGYDASVIASPEGGIHEFASYGPRQSARVREFESLGELSEPRFEKVEQIKPEKPEYFEVSKAIAPTYEGQRGSVEFGGGGKEGSPKKSWRVTLNDGSTRIVEAESRGLAAKAVKSEGLPEGTKIAGISEKTSDYKEGEIRKGIRSERGNFEVRLRDKDTGEEFTRTARKVYSEEQAQNQVVTAFEGIRNVEVVGVGESSKGIPGRKPKEKKAKNRVGQLEADLEASNGVVSGEIKARYGIPLEVESPQQALNWVKSGVEKAEARSTEARGPIIEKIEEPPKTSEPVKEEVKVEKSPVDEAREAAERLIAPKEEPPAKPATAKEMMQVLEQEEALAGPSEKVEQGPSGKPPKGPRPPKDLPVRWEEGGQKPSRGKAKSFTVTLSDGSKFKESGKDANAVAQKVNNVIQGTESELTIASIEPTVGALEAHLRTRKIEEAGPSEVSKEQVQVSEKVAKEQEREQVAARNAEAKRLLNEEVKMQRERERLEKAQVKEKFKKRAFEVKLDDGSTYPIRARTAEKARQEAESILSKSGSNYKVIDVKEKLTGLEKKAAGEAESKPGHWQERYKKYGITEGDSFTQAFRKMPSDVRLFETLNMFKSLRAGGDVGHLKRQGKMMLSEILFSKDAPKILSSLKKTAKGLVSEKAFNAYHLAMAKNPTIARMVNEFKLDMPGLPGHLKEEAFYGTLAERIPGIGKFYVKPSERAYTLGLNTMREIIVEREVKTATNLYNMRNKTKLSPQEVMSKDPKMFRDIARGLNIISQRGDFGPKWQQRLSDAAGIIWAPRSRVSRFQLIREVTRGGQGGKLARRSLAKTIASNAAKLALLKAIHGEAISVGDDPERSDFLKLRFKDKISEDPWFGLGPIIRSGLKTHHGYSISAHTGRKTTVRKPIDPAVDYLLTGVAPAIDFLSILATGKDVGGFPKYRWEAFKSLVPLTAEEVKEIYDEEGFEGILFMLDSATGEGVDVYNAEKEADKRKRLNYERGQGSSSGKRGRRVIGAI